jgi:hypothetical protein
MAARFGLAHANVTEPDGTKHKDVRVVVYANRLTVAPQQGATLLEVDSVESVKGLARSWRVHTADGVYEVRKSTGGCGCGGK